MASDEHADHLVWKRATVDGRSALYGVAGEGLPLLFIHGWGLGQHAYKRSLKRLVNLGCRVWAPALPGFGGTSDLPASERSLGGYAAWVDEFCRVVGLDEPAIVVGHSFGGGVSIKLAHDYPARVRTLVLINSIGGSAWSSKGSVVRSMAERPLWDWGIHFPADVLPGRQLTRVLPVVLEDFLPNVLRNPLAMWRVGGMARRADLTAELEELKRRELPVVVLWGDNDKIIPRDSFDALCAAIGREGEVVSGAHSWLLADPDAFGEVMTNILDVARMAQQLESDEVDERAPTGLARRLLGGLGRRG
ncbi:MAG: Alpha/beta hydrolase fold [Acidimicrobiales bacterium]|nr:Alpha/beta hydrolase fold [Acidimicrobiales bacterium]